MFTEKRQDMVLITYLSFIPRHAHTGHKAQGRGKGEITISEPAWLWNPSNIINKRTAPSANDSFHSPCLLPSYSHATATTPFFRKYIFTVDKKNFTIFFLTAFFY